MLPQYLFLLLSQLVNLAFQARSTRRLRSLARQEQLLQARGRAAARAGGGCMPLPRLACCTGPQRGQGRARAGVARR